MINAHYLYRWSARNQTDALSEGEITARSRQKARQRLQQQGFYFVDLQYLARVPPNRRNASSKRLQFTQQLALLLPHGLTLPEIFSLFINNEPSIAWRWLWQQLSQEIAKGSPLSQALQQYPSLFPKLYCALIRVGEWSGQLENCCQQLIQQEEKQQQHQQSLRKALLYPLFTLTLTLLITLFMLIVVIPCLQTVYQASHQALPPLTQGLIQLSQWLNQNRWLLLTLLIGLPFSYGAGRRYQPTWRAKEQSLILQISIVGSLIKQICCAQFTRTLAVTQNAGLPIVFGIQAAGDSSSNFLYQQAAHTMAKAIQQGHSLQQVFRHPLFPAFISQMVAIGEASGTLERALLAISEYYEQQVQQKMAYLLTLLEPLLVTVIGIIIGIIIIALYLPLFQLGQTIH